MEKHQSIYNRYLEILEIIKGDNVAEKLLNELIDKSCNYMDIAIQKATLTMFNKQEQKDLKEAEAYIALKSAITSFNRYFSEKYGQMPFLDTGLSDNDKTSIENWVVEFIQGIFKNRKK